MLAAILSVEALEDNEVLIVEGVRHVSRIHDPRNRATFEPLSKPNVVSVFPVIAKLRASSRFYSRLILYSDTRRR